MDGDSIGPDRFGGSESRIRGRRANLDHDVVERLLTIGIFQGEKVVRHRGSLTDTLTAIPRPVETQAYFDLILLFGLQGGGSRGFSFSMSEGG
jgi:hypothetical protein